MNVQLPVLSVKLTCTSARVYLPGPLASVLIQIVLQVVCFNCRKDVAGPGERTLRDTLRDGMNNMRTKKSGSWQQYWPEINRFLTWLHIKHPWCWTSPRVWHLRKYDCVSWSMRPCRIAGVTVIRTAYSNRSGIQQPACSDFAWPIMSICTEFFLFP
jgi:hypothetical protein